MKRIITVAFAFAMIMALAAPVSAHRGRSFDQANRNDGCFQAGPNDYWHCFNPGQGQGNAASLSVFDDEGGNHFLGVESINFFAETQEPFASGVPCPKDTGSGEWEWVDDPGFWACHHWKGKP